MLAFAVFNREIWKELLCTRKSSRSTKWGNFVAQWVPTCLIIGLYNKVVKQEGHDQFDRG